MSSEQSQKVKEQQLAAAERFPTTVASASDPEPQSRSGTSSNENRHSTRSRISRQSDASSSVDTWFATSSSEETSSDEEPLKLNRPNGHAVVQRSAVRRPPNPDRQNHARPASLASLRDLVRYEKLARKRIADLEYPSDVDLHETVQKLKTEDIAGKEAAEKVHRKRMRKQRRLQRQQNNSEGSKDVEHSSAEPVQSYVVSGPEVEARKAAYRRKYKFIPHAIKVKPLEAKQEYLVIAETGFRRVKGMGIALKSCPYLYGGEDEEGNDIWLIKGDIPMTGAADTAQS